MTNLYVDLKYYKQITRLIHVMGPFTALHTTMRLKNKEVGSFPDMMLQHQPGSFMAIEGCKQKNG